MSAAPPLAPDVAADIQSRLRSELKGVLRGRKIERIECPGCGKPEAYAFLDNLRVIHCPRKNSCGEPTRVKALWPDLFENWSTRFKRTDENPHAAATAYLQHARGLNTHKLADAYTQEWYHDDELKIGTATVRFKLSRAGGGHTWWERLIDQPGRFGDMKARFEPGARWRGEAWSPPGQTLDDILEAGELWIAEGVFEAASLREAGLCAIAAMSSSHYPDAWLKRLAEHAAVKDASRPRPDLVWALNADAAGRAGIRKHVAQGRAEGWVCGAAIPHDSEAPGTPDWNDLHIAGKLTESHRADYLHHGQVEIAPDPTTRAHLIFEWNRANHSFVFAFDNQTYSAKFDAGLFEALTFDDGDERKKVLSQVEATHRCLKVKRIANCALHPLYFQRDEEKDETYYHLELRFPGKHRKTRGLFSSSAMTKVDAFAKRFSELSPAAIWYGSPTELIKLRERWTSTPIVTPTHLTGYVREHEAYVFPDFAVHHGVIHELNREDYFALPKVSIKPTDGDRILRITRPKREYDTGWLPDLRRAYGKKGLVVLAWWFGTLFAEQIRARHQSWPFLEWYGQAGSGKSTLLEFLWRLLGRDGYEGLDPNKGSVAYRRRQFAKPANLPVVLIESDREQADSKIKQFDWDELKTAYNGRSVAGRAATNNGMETMEPPFRGAIAISQNAPIAASIPMLERIVQLKWDKADHKPGSRQAAVRLMARQTEDLSGFILEAVKRERDVLAAFAQSFVQHEAAFLRDPRFTNERLAKNYAQLAACLDALATVLPIPLEERDDMHDFIAELGAARHQLISVDHETVQLFWERVHHLLEAEGPQAPSLNHSRDEGLIAINLNEFEVRAANAKFEKIDSLTLRKLLKTSRHPRFIDCRTVNSANAGLTDGRKSVHCWVFQRTSQDVR